MIHIGPYRFSDEDARSTVAVVGPLWQHYAHRRDLDAALEAIRPPERADLGQVWQAMHALRPALRDAGALPPRADGVVHQLNVSGGGVPKLPVPSVEIGFDGVAGDRQGDRRHHGRPWQAISLWSTDAIDEFTAEGHPIGPGSAGENVTVSGVPWADVRPGVRLRLGTALCEVSAYAIPCAKNAQWFADRDSRHMSHTRGDRSRVYATVIEPGRVDVGDPAVLEP